MLVFCAFISTFAKNLHPGHVAAVSGGPLREAGSVQKQGPSLRRGIRSEARKDPRRDLAGPESGANRKTIPATKLKCVKIH